MFWLLGVKSIMPFICDFFLALADKFIFIGVCFRLTQPANLLKSHLPPLIESHYLWKIPLMQEGFYVDTYLEPSAIQRMRHLLVLH